MCVCVCVLCCVVLCCVVCVYERERGRESVCMGWGGEAGGVYGNEEVKCATVATTKR